MAEIETVQERDAKSLSGIETIIAKIEEHMEAWNGSRVSIDADKIGGLPCAHVAMTLTNLYLEKGFSLSFSRDQSSGDAILVTRA